MMYDTIREAATAWVNGFNAVPTTVVEKLMRLDPGAGNYARPQR